MVAAFNGVKVFSATMFRQHHALGELVTQWIADNPNLTLVDRVVTQSSDEEFHCITITLFYRTADCFATKAEERKSKGLSK